MDVSIFSLWLPILLSSIAVFFASFLFWMVIGHHKSDYKKTTDEPAMLDAIRKQKLALGAYSVPHCDPSEMKDPAVAKKFDDGPVAMITIFPNGMNMGKSLTQWFIYTLYIGIVTAYLCGVHHLAGANYLKVFQTAGCAAFLAYTTAIIPQSIWKGLPWKVALKEVFDGTVYALLTAGIFASMWPDA